MGWFRVGKGGRPFWAAGYVWFIDTAGEMGSLKPVQHVSARANGNRATVFSTILGQLNFSLAVEAGPRVYLITDWPGLTLESGWFDV